MESKRKRFLRHGISKQLYQTLMQMRSQPWKMHEHFFIQSVYGSEMYFLLFITLGPIWFNLDFAQYMVQCGCCSIYGPFKDIALECCSYILWLKYKQHECCSSINITKWCSTEIALNVAHNEFSFKLIVHIQMHIVHTQYITTAIYFAADHS